MNTNQIQSFARWLLNAIAGGIITYTATKSDATKGLGAWAAQLLTGPDVIAGVVMLITLAWGHFTHKALPPMDAAGNPLPKVAVQPPTSTGNNALNLFVGLALLGSLALGCAHLAPGADPLVVRVEQTQTTAKGAFDLVLKFDHANRPYWRTNAPAFHDFCEWLRVPTTTTAGVSLPRCSAMLWTLDSVKVAYKAGSASSNALVTALATVTEAANQANAWLTITKGN